jgi:hypothetical protein
VTLYSGNDKERKNTPVFKMRTRYFPKALREVTKVCVANNVRYNPDKEPADINWARGKSADQLGSLDRHITEREVDGKIFEHIDPAIAEKVGFDRIYVMAEAAWRALAQLELDIEAEEAKAPAQAVLGSPKSLDESVLDAMAKVAANPSAGLFSGPKQCPSCGSHGGSHRANCGL